MREKEFRIVDVFTIGKYSGNQLAVVMAGDNMDSIKMQSIAQEMNYSETTFITGGDLENGFDVRIFTPAIEIPFAGHPVLGTAYVACTELCEGEPKTIKLILKAGQIDVTIEYNGNNPSLLTMRQQEPEFGEIFESSIFPGILGLHETDVPEDFPVQHVSTGLSFAIVPIRSLEAMGRISLQLDKYSQFAASTEAKGLLCFCTETVNRENQLHVRMFAPGYGIMEDSATGSGNGCLAAYLLKYSVFGKGEVKARSEQGIEMGRSSLLYLSAFREGSRIIVHVGGAVVPTAKGILI
jgi:trans-2,3-dihydro-3-hydroxyanthranilate isomerase